MHEQTSGRDRDQREIDHCGDTGDRTDEGFGSTHGHTSYLRHLAELVYRRIPTNATNIRRYPYEASMRRLNALWKRRSRRSVQMS